MPATLYSAKFDPSVANQSLVDQTPGSASLTTSGPWEVSMYLKSDDASARQHFYQWGGGPASMATRLFNNFFSQWYTGGFGNVNYDYPSPATWVLINFWTDAGGATVGASMDGGTPVTASLSPAMGGPSEFLEIGAATSYPAFPYKGLMATVCRWKRVLSAGERTWLAASRRKYSDFGVAATGGSPLLVNIESAYAFEDASNLGLDSRGARNLMNVNGVTQFTEVLAGASVPSGGTMSAGYQEMGI